MVRARDLLEDVGTPHVVDSASIAAIQSFASDARVICRSGGGANAGSSPSNAQKASRVPDPHCARSLNESTEPEKGG